MNITNKSEVLKILKEASYNYYNNLEEILTDEEYDKLLQIAVDNSWIKQDEEVNDGATINVNNTVEHTIPMLSLEKAKSIKDVEKYFNYIKKFNKNATFSIEPKIDGLALSVKYVNGKITTVATRGNGKQGENVTYLINNKDVIIENLPLEIDNTLDVVEIRGELYCKKSNLQTINANRGIDFQNERVAVSGIIKKAEKGLGYEATLSFAPYFAYINNNRISLSEITKENVNTMFKECPEEIDNINSLEFYINEANKWRNEIDAPTDGIVIKPVQIFETEEATSHHPREFIAYKYPGIEKETIVTNVVWNVGKTGRINPIANVKPVKIDNVEISNITIHNIDWLNSMGIKIGAVVNVTRANDVIPAITKVISYTENSKDIEVPEYCPICKHKTVIKDKFVYCENNSCSGKVKNKILSYTSKGVLDIEGFNNALVNALDVKDIVDVITLPLSELETLKYNNNISLGERRANTIYNNIQYAKENTPEYIWLTTLDFDGVGISMAKTILKEFNNIDTFLEQSNRNTLSNINGIGDVYITNILNNIEKAKSIWSRLKEHITIKNNNKIVESRGSVAITGKVPAMFKNRDELVKALENIGYEYHSSVKKDTQSLIVEDVNSNSTKIKKAREKGVALISHSEIENILKEAIL